MRQGWIAGSSVLVPLSVAVGIWSSLVHQHVPQSANASVPFAIRQQQQPRTDATLSPDRLFAQVSPAVAQVIVLDSHMQPRAFGSGFFVSADGLLVTNFHVIQRASQVEVKVAGRGALAVEGAAAIDVNSDLALLKVKADGLPTLRLGEGQLPSVGTRCFAVGSPEGLTNTLSEGLISGVRTPPQGSGTWIQTSAAISHGSSGGPLVAPDGTVLGVTSACIMSGQNLNFAVPTSAVSRLIRARGTLIPIDLASRGGTCDTVADSTTSEGLKSQENQELRDVWAVILRGRFSEAKDRLDEMRQRQAGNAQYWYAAGIVAAQLGDAATATAAFTESIRLQPSNPSAYFGLGRTLATQRKFQEALGAFGDGERLFPNESKFFFQAGLVWMDLGDSAHALKSFTRAAELTPKDVATQRMMGLAYYKSDRFGAAVDAFDRALKIDPTDIGSLIGAGDAHRRIGEYQDAKESYLRAMVLAPSNPWAPLGIGWTYYFLHDYPSAAAAWRAAAKLDPRGKAGAYANQNLLKLYRELGWK